MKRFAFIIIIFAAAFSFCICAPAGHAAELVAEDDAAAGPSPAPTESPAPTDSIFDLMQGEKLGYQVDMAAYYLEQMTKAAETGAVAEGQQAEQCRNAAIDASMSGQQKINFDELYLLSRIICHEAGSDWLSQEFRMCVGEVVMNRVASPEFPDSIYGVVHQKGQYSGVDTLSFEYMKPGKDCVSCALRLLQGERLMAPSVVYHSNWIQGEIFSMYTDRRLGNTYFCVSKNLELYPIE